MKKKTLGKIAKSSLHYFKLIQSLKSIQQFPINLNNLQRKSLNLHKMILTESTKSTSKAPNQTKGKEKRMERSRRKGNFGSKGNFWGKEKTTNKNYFVEKEEQKDNPRFFP